MAGLAGICASWVTENPTCRNGEADQARASGFQDLKHWLLSGPGGSRLFLWGYAPVPLTLAIGDGGDLDRAIIVA